MTLIKQGYDNNDFDDDDNDDDENNDDDDDDDGELRICKFTKMLNILHLHFGQRRERTDERTEGSNSKYPSPFHGENIKWHEAKRYRGIKQRYRL